MEPKSTRLSREDASNSEPESARAVLALEGAFEETLDGTFIQLRQIEDRQAQQLVKRLCEAEVKEESALQLAGSSENRLVAAARVALKIAQVLLLNVHELVRVGRELRRDNPEIERADLRRALLRRLASATEVTRSVRTAAREILEQEPL